MGSALAIPVGGEREVVFLPSSSLLCLRSPSLSQWFCKQLVIAIPSFVLLPLSIFYKSASVEQLSGKLPGGQRAKWKRGLGRARGMHHINHVGEGGPAFAHRR